MQGTLKIEGNENCKPYESNLLWLFVPNVIYFNLLRIVGGPLQDLEQKILYAKQGHFRGAKILWLPRETLRKRGF